MKRVVVCSVTVIVLLAMAWFGISAFSRQYLYIRDENQRLQFEVRPGDKIYFSYTQSLYHVQQTEVFEVQNNNTLLLREMVFGSLNALYYYDEQNLNYYEKDGNVYLVDLNKSFVQIPFRASYSKSHSITIQSAAVEPRIIDVSACFPAGGSLEMGLRRWWEQ